MRGRLNLVENLSSLCEKEIQLALREIEQKVSSKLKDKIIGENYYSWKRGDGIGARGGNAMQNGLLGQTAITSNTMRFFPTKVIQGERLAPPKWWNSNRFEDVPHRAGVGPSETPP